MIKINLLGAAAPKAKGKPKPVAQVSKAKQLGAFFGAFAVSLAIVGVIYLVWNASIAKLNVELRKQQAEQARLAAIKQENVRYEHERALLEQRINTIQLLRASRLGPTEFMNALGNVVDRTAKDLYLSSVTPQGDRVVIHGEAGSPNSVANLMSTMKTSGYFSDVQLRQFYEDDVHEHLNYKFNMDCAYKSLMAPSSAPQAKAAAIPAGAAPRPRL